MNKNICSRLNKKKGSMELSVNSIVILVIAIVMMGLILGFIQKWFKDTTKDLGKAEPDPNGASSSDPLSMSRETYVGSPGKDFGMKVDIFNPTPGKLTNVQPWFGCKSPIKQLYGNFFNRTLEAGAHNVFVGNVKTASNIPKGEYLCQVCLINTSITGVWADYTTKGGCGPGIARQEAIIAYKEFNLKLE